MKKINEKSSSLDILMNVIEKQVSAEFETLSYQALFVAKVLQDNAVCKQILSAYGYKIDKKPEFLAFVKDLKQATFERFSNLPALVESVEKDVTTGKDVTVQYTRKMPAIWYNDKTAQIVNAKHKLQELIDPETQGRYEKVITLNVPIYKDVEITYKDAKGETRKKTIKQLSGYSEEKEIRHAYLRPVWKVSHIVDGLQNMLVFEDCKSTISAKLLKEFENAAKK